MPTPKSLLVLFGILFTSLVSAQTPNDTALNPYWIDMMKAPGANYYKVKRAFDLYWKDSVPTRGHGYKVFKRWEWRVKDKMLPDGSIQWNSGPLNEDGFNAGQSNRDLIGMAAPCPANGRWTAVGPQKHPYNQSSQPTGIGRIGGFAFHPKRFEYGICAGTPGRCLENHEQWRHLDTFVWQKPGGKLDRCKFYATEL